MEFKMALTGDSLLTRRLPHSGSDKYVAVQKMIHESDLAFTNLEFTVPAEPWIAAPKADGINMTMHIGSSSDVLDDLKEYGFNLYSGANNHSVDYNYEGLCNTVDELAKRRMACAGIGYNLPEAEEPKYLTVGDLRVAIIAAASTYTYGALASNPRATRAGRPGLNPLRFSTEYQLDAEHFTMLKSIDQALGTKELTEGKMRMGLLKDIGKYPFMKAYFTEGEICEIKTRVDHKDLERIVNQITGARRQADYVIMSLHAHEGLHGIGSNKHAAEFVREAAHAFIDAGADLFVGHGPHVVRPLELYQGKPIFYSLGNFMFTIESLETLPAESFEQHDLPLAAVAADVHDIWTQKPDGSANIFMTKQDYWHTVLPICEVKDKNITAIRIYPVTLGQYFDRGTKGLPMLASGTEGKAILDQFAEMSREYGTLITVTQDRNGNSWAEVKLCGGKV